MTQININELVKAQRILEDAQGKHRIPGILLNILGKLRRALGHSTIPHFEDETTYSLKEYQEAQNQEIVKKWAKGFPRPTSVDIQIDTNGQLGEVSLGHSTKVIDIYFDDYFSRLVVGKRGYCYDYNNKRGWSFKSSPFFSDGIEARNCDGEGLVKELLSENEIGTDAQKSAYLRMIDTLAELGAEIDLDEIKRLIA